MAEVEDEAQSKIPSQRGDELPLQRGDVMAALRSMMEDDISV